MEHVDSTLRHLQESLLKNTLSVVQQVQDPLSLKTTQTNIFTIQRSLQIKDKS